MKSCQLFQKERQGILIPKMEKLTQVVSAFSENLAGIRSQEPQAPEPLKIRQNFVGSQLALKQKLVEVYFQQRTIIENLKIQPSFKLVQQIDVHAIEQIR